MFMFLDRFRFPDISCHSIIFQMTALGKEGGGGSWGRKAGISGDLRRI